MGIPLPPTISDTENTKEALESAIGYMSRLIPGIRPTDSVPSSDEGLDGDMRLYSLSGTKRFYVKISGTWENVSEDTDTVTADTTELAVADFVAGDQTENTMTGFFTTFGGVHFFYVNSSATKTLQISYRVIRSSGSAAEARINVDSGTVSTGVSTTSTSYVTLTETLSVTALTEGWHTIELQLKQTSVGDAKQKEWVVFATD